MALPALIFLPLMLLLKGKGEGMMPFVHGIILVVPNGTSPALLPLLMLAPFVLSLLLCFGLEKKREYDEKRTGTAPPSAPDAAHQTPTWLTMLPVLPMGLILFVLPLLSIPIVSRGIGTVLSPFSQTGRYVAIMSFLMVLTFGNMFLLSRYVRKKTQQNLKPGDHWYDQVQTMADEAGVKIRHVTITRSPSSNASMSVWGTVNLTSKLLVDFEPDEIRAIIAHEIGHHKESHPLRNLVLSLLVTSVLLGVWYGGRYWLEQRFNLSTEVKTLFRMPLFSIFILPVLRNLLTGKTSRQHEFEADRFAVQVTGDPELVIRTLRKLHTLSAQPHHLKMSDELLHSHPSLANRIEAIRREAGTTTP